MAVWTCLGCTADYSVGAPRCPQCGSTEHHEEGQNMPKITVAGGPSIAGVTGTWGDEDLADEGSEQPSASSSSPTSSEKPQTSPETNDSDPQPPARTTANRSKKARTGSSSAPGTAGDPTAPTSDTDK